MKGKDFQKRILKAYVYFQELLDDGLTVPDHVRRYQDGLSRKVMDDIHKQNQVETTGKAVDK